MSKIQTRKVPKLRFPGFSGEWEEMKLGNIATKVGSGSTPRGGSKVYKKYGIPFIRSQNVSGGKLDMSDVVFIDEVTHKSMKNSAIKPNDVLLNITGASLGRTCVVPQSFSKGNLSQHVCIIRLNHDINPYLVHTVLSQPKSLHELLKTQTGGGKEGLNFQAVRAFKLTLPNNEEQQKIAGFLGVVDEQISGLQKKVELLQKYKKGIMQKIFSQEIRFKDENGKDYPAWQQKKLVEVGATYNGLQGKSGGDFGQGKPYISYKQIFASSALDTSKFELVKVDADEKQSTAQYGDVFFTTSSETPEEVGYSSVLLDKIEGLYLNSFCFGYRIENQRLFSPAFSRFLFRSEGFRRKVVRMAQGSTRYNLSKLGFMKTQIQLPSPEEQLKIANFLTSIDEKIEVEERKLEHAKFFKKALLQQMFV